jgi:RimJ/RimL family protein N-acetyltransferase
MIIEGKYVKLRPIAVEDAGLTLKWRLSDRARYLHQGSKTIEEQMHWISLRLNKENELNFIIEYDNMSVGMIAIYEIDQLHKSCEWGRFLIGEKEIVGTAPVAYESELILSDYIFNNLQMHKIYGDVMEDNQAMIKYRIFIGYKKDGIPRDHYAYNGKYKNTIAFSLLEDQYRNVCRPKLLSLLNLYSSML